MADPTPAPASSPVSVSDLQLVAKAKLLGAENPVLFRILARKDPEQRTVRLETYIAELGAVPTVMASTHAAPAPSPPPPPQREVSDFGPVPGFEDLSPKPSVYQPSSPASAKEMAAANLRLTKPIIDQASARLHALQADVLFSSCMEYHKLLGMVHSDILTSARGPLHPKALRELQFLVDHLAGAMRAHGEMMLLASTD